MNTAKAPIPAPPQRVAPRVGQLIAEQEAMIRELFKFLASHKKPKGDADERKP